MNDRNKCPKCGANQFDSYDGYNRLYRCGTNVYGICGNDSIAQSDLCKGRAQGIKEERERNKKDLRSLMDLVGSVLGKRMSYFNASKQVTQAIELREVEVLCDIIYELTHGPKDSDER